MGACCQQNSEAFDGLSADYIRRLKIVIALGLVAALLLASATALVGGALITGGVASVALESRQGPDLERAVPGGLIVLAAAAVGGLSEHGDVGGPARLALETIPAEALSDAPIAAVIADLLGSLETVPDATLVEVRDGADRVEVVKRGRYLEVRVVDGADDLDLVARLPIRTAQRTVGLLLD